MPSSINNTLLVGVQSILYHSNSGVGGNDYSLTSTTSGFFATIDSTLPYLYLPDEIVDKFVDKFRLQYDSGTEMYLLNDTSHKFNIQKNPNVAFKIGSTPSVSLNSVTITLPCAPMKTTSCGSEVQEARTKIRRTTAKATMSYWQD